ncbi:hypothetical protein [Luteimicrobium subarcticum]|uniref:hypothetical protein n=1 Tax=Luteimicrobium subarcticum TaxID=620910 RepID=UPI0012FDF391|nr:hypothetical protein [Luteimicrobium subarcticum]
MVRDLVLGAVLLPAVAVTLARAVGLDRRTPFAQVVSMTPWCGALALLVLLVALVLRGWWVCSVAAAVVVAQAVWLAPLAVAPRSRRGRTCAS